MNCRVCHQELAEPVFSAGRSTSLSSMGTVQEQDTVVFSCRRCGHVQTPPIGDLNAYYDSDYEVSVGSEDEDQLYKLVDGKPIYRTAFQAQTLLEKVSVPQGGRVLDFGAAKGMTANHVAKMRSDVKPFLFDVTDRYTKYWQEFVDVSQTACYELPDEWNSSFDVVMSFYVLEHVDIPETYVNQARSLLKPDGIFYFVVPNVFNHTSEFIVVDHVNHFTRASLRHMLTAAGLEPLFIDDETHDGAWVVGARLSKEVEQANVGVIKLASQWVDIYAQLARFADIAAKKQVAIYGSSFWGSLIATNFPKGVKAKQFLDQNPHFHGRAKFGTPIVDPSEIDADVTDVLVGLDPLRAREIIAQVHELTSKNITFHYLESAPIDRVK